MKKIPLAVQYMLLSTISFSMMNAVIKYLVNFPAFELVFFRSIGTLIITTILLRSRKISFFPKQPWLLLIRGLFGVTSMILFFVSVHYIPIGTLVSIRYIAPLFAAPLAVLFLKERVYALQLFFFLIAFIGVVFIKGFDTGVSMIGVLLALAAAFFSALVYILLSKIGTRDESILVVHYFMAISTLVGAIGYFYTWISPDLNDLFLLLSLGVFGFFGQLFMTKAFQTGEASKIAPVKYVEVFFTVSLGIYWFGEAYTFYSFLGIFLIVFGLTSGILYKQWRSVKEGLSK